MTERDTIAVFNDTLSRCRISYADSTAKTSKATKFYADPSIKFANMAREYLGGTVLFQKGGSVSTAYDEANYGHVAVLDFADALKPGGYPERGALTQEENICRCSNLYIPLIQHPEYFEQNRLAGDERYTDGILYVPHVIIFRDDETYDIVSERCVDVIVCPAPSAVFDDADELLLRRAKGIVQSAAFNGVDTLVLGAWGCGVFSQDPFLVGKAFAAALNLYNPFKKVIFAFRPTPGFGPDNNYTETLNGFVSVYERKVYEQCKQRKTV